MMKVLKLRCNFCFFKQQISTKYGKKCCRYNQDGKPMEAQLAEETLSKMKEDLNGWKLNYGKMISLRRFYYAEDYYLGMDFIKQVVNIDRSDFLQCPTFSLQNGQLLKFQLYSISLKGLSLLDFHLAIRINTLPIKGYRLISLQDEDNYKEVVSNIRKQRQKQNKLN